MKTNKKSCLFSEFCLISATISHITSRVRYPSAAHSDPYCLLCFQPKPLRDSSTLVKPSLLMDPTSDYELGQGGDSQRNDSASSQMTAYQTSSYNPHKVTAKLPQPGLINYTLIFIYYVFNFFYQFMGFANSLTLMIINSSVWILLKIQRSI
ncbi:unnamed protein product (macronuclear) [Paramecium tetraurelia]|uniref:Uncharacterized protein n=1 Tax=Paramecium tetraurelia TaxID=5888 RepID=A0E6K6_PARTE|nr:uncharacterized protein GSPATT00003788001 [Paramecium tetraurelia]CAK90923.1 unnamed protein product [Paramecium tetraurelia]|eukprot:XP_001458320.1 hypothetical protein (macronuclear) [Paramecium tetraurelia strain d4-2]